MSAFAANTPSPVVAKNIHCWKPSLPDYRDFKYTEHLMGPTANLPPLIDLRSKCPPVVDQLSLGSCTSNALACALEFMRERMAGDNIIYSRLFIYYYERFFEGDVNEDAGANLRTGIKVLATKGDCPESLNSYDITKFATPPSPQAILSASKIKISSYYRLSSWLEMKHCLSTGFPVVFGAAVYDEIDGDEVANSGYLSFPNTNSSDNGGHAIIAVGYGRVSDFISPANIARYRLNPNELGGLIRNSWGLNWGINGYFFMPESYLNSDLIDDMWTVRA